jgi:hypothetical protein
MSSPVTPRTPSPPPRDAGMSLVVVLGSMLVGAYLAWVLGWGWIVLAVLDVHGVTTSGWIGTIVAAMLIGVGATYAGPGRVESLDRFTPLVAGVVPILVELVAFVGIRVR